MTQVGTVLSLFRFPVKSMSGDNPDAIDVSESGFSGDRGWAVRDERRGDFATGKRVATLMSCRAIAASSDGAYGVPQIELPNGDRFAANDEAASKRLSEALGRDVTLWPIGANPAPPESVEEVADPAADFRSTMARAADEPMPDFSAIPPELLATFGNPERPYVDFAPLMLLSQQSLDSIASAAPDSEIDVRRFRPSVLVDTPSDEAFPEQAWIGKRVQIGEVVLDLRMTCPRCVMTTHGFADLAKDPTVMRTLVKQAEGNLGVYATVAQTGTIRVGDVIEVID